MVCYTSCLFLVMGKFGYSLLERGAGAGPKVKQQLASNCENREDKGRRRRTGEVEGDDLNSLLPGSAFRLVPPSGFTYFWLVSAEAFDGLQTIKNKKNKNSISLTIGAQTSKLDHKISLFKMKH